jgi:SAM-dependent methyltransferase
VSGHHHDTGPRLDEGFWNERYRSSPHIWSGNPNPQLVAEIADRVPGRALDAGCGEGADAVWLAQRGWEVVATDISRVALGRAARHARDAAPAAAARIEWRHVDLLVNAPEQGAFDLVSAQFMQLPPHQRGPLFFCLAAAVAPGGTLLVVGHHPSDLETTVRRPRGTGVLYAAEDVLAVLDRGVWNVLVSVARPRSAVDPEGRTVTVHDTVVRAQRRP